MMQFEKNFQNIMIKLNTKKWILIAVSVFVKVDLLTMDIS